MNRQLGNLEYGWKNVLQEHAHGSFTCSQCHHRWSSHQVVIQFHMHRDQFQGMVRMKVFRQQCDKCSSGKYEEPQFTKEDTGNIIKHLICDIREKCYGELVDRRELSEVITGHTGPHKHQHCEACKLGIHKWHHWSTKGRGHHGKDRMSGLSWITKETMTLPKSPVNSLATSACCICCFCLTVIFILIFTSYL